MHSIFKSLRVFCALILREMSTTYGRSPGGYIWAFLEPAAGTALLTFIFSLAFRAPPIGASFPFFYATGLLPFMIYMEVSSKISQSIAFSKALLFYPNVTYIDAVLARFFLNFLTQLAVFICLIFGVMFFAEINTSVQYMAVLNALMMVAALSLGIGTLNCFLNSLFPIWIRIWAIFNRPLLVVSCVIFLFRSVPKPYSDILWFNPLIHIIGEMRRAFYPTYDAYYVASAYVYGFSGTCFLIALVFLNRYHRDILNT